MFSRGPRDNQRARPRASVHKCPSSVTASQNANAVLAFPLFSKILYPAIGIRWAQHQYIQNEFGACMHMPDVHALISRVYDKSAYNICTHLSHPARNDNWVQFIDHSFDVLWYGLAFHDWDEAKVIRCPAQCANMIGRPTCSATRAAMFLSCSCPSAAMLVLFKVPLPRQPSAAKLRMLFGFMLRSCKLFSKASKSACDDSPAICTLANGSTLKDGTPGRDAAGRTP